MARRAALKEPDETLDEAQQEGQSSRSGPISEEDRELELSRRVAKRMGWVDRDEWKRDPSKWTDAPQFLENTPSELESYKERLKRTGQAAEAAIAETARQARIDAEQRLRAAVEAKDADAAVTASNDIARSSGPPPQTVAWMGRNPWFNEDPDAQMLAVAEITRQTQRGASIEQQLEAAENKVRLRFPEYFDWPGKRPEPEERTETRLSERAAPAVQPGNRGGNSTPKAKGFADIPQGDRALYQRHFAKRYESTGKKPEEAQALYASAYWANKDEE